jgi:pyridoxal phosphate enzyme (YggS family)
VTVASGVAAVRDRIRAAGADPDRVRIIAATKGFDDSVVREALAAGIVDIGESYAQELGAKASALDGDPPAAWPVWHFIGRLQRNKVRKVAGLVSMWHSVDHLSLGGEIARWAPGAAVLAQINTTGEDQKGGCPPARALALVDGLRDLGLDVQGLMTIGPAGPADLARPAFRSLAALAADLDLHELSMGMSADLEVAVQEGATLVRVGTAIFGPRPGSIVVGK